MDLQLQNNYLLKETISQQHGTYRPKSPGRFVTSMNNASSTSNYNNNSQLNKVILIWGFFVHYNFYSR